MPPVPPSDVRGIADPAGSPTTHPTQPQLTFIRNNVRGQDDYGRSTSSASVNAKPGSSPPSST
jgi:hypothetical protein